MIKTFCDICKNEIRRNYVSSRIQGRGYRDGNDPVMVQIIVGIPPSWNSGALCRDCLRTAVLDAIDSDVAAHE